MAEMTLNQILGTKNSGKMTLIGKETGKVYDFPFINSVSVKTDAKESDYAYANGITKKVTFAGEKDGSISFKTDLYTIELLSFITSSPITVGETEVFKTEIFEAGASELSKLTLKNEASKVLAVDIVDIDEVKQESLEAELSSSNKNEITVTVPAGKRVKVFYLTKITEATKITVNDKPQIVEAFTAYIDVISTKSDTKGGGQVCLQITCPNTRPEGGLSLDFDGNSVSQYEFSLTLTPDEKNRLYDYVILAES